MEFKIGDRVRMVKSVDGFKANSIGTVRYVWPPNDCSYAYGVEFDTREFTAMHSLNTYGTNRGWNCTKESLQIYMECNPIEIENLI